MERDVAKERRKTQKSREWREKEKSRKWSRGGT